MAVVGVIPFSWRVAITSALFQSIPRPSGLGCLLEGEHHYILLRVFSAKNLGEILVFTTR